MTYIMVDVEADGPIPGDYSMVCFGAIVVEPSLDRTFYGRLKPIGATPRRCCRSKRNTV
jgi:hypothetical protein